MNCKMHTGGKDKTKRIPIGTIQPNLRLKIKLARVSINDRTAMSIGLGCKNSIGFLWRGLVGRPTAPELQVCSQISGAMTNAPVRREVKRTHSTSL